MEFAELKPLLTSLVLPPLAPLLLALLGVLLAFKKRRGGLALAALSLVLLWLLSCHGVAVWLAR
ncbi:MAG: YdcF family protein, partial [Polaromonas sp.]